MKTIITFGILLCAFATFSQNDGLRQRHFNIENKVAISGYDPVSYFTTNKAEEGKKEISTTYGGIVYYFSSTANRDLFKNNAAKYEPQFGGWCAYAMGATGEKVEVDPETFKIIEGKLYLFYNKYFNNTLKSWNKDEAALKRKAEKAWATIFQ